MLVSLTFGQSSIVIPNGASIVVPENAYICAGTITVNGTITYTGSSLCVVPNAHLIASIVETSALNEDGYYKIGDEISVTLTFTRNVVVTGIPQLALGTGDIDGIANYASGNETVTLTFNYIVKEGDTSPDLEYMSTTALSLNGGSIKNMFDKDAELLLPEPGATKSLSANTTGGSNTMVGHGAGKANTTGSDNTAIGLNSMASNTTGSRNTALGYAALPNNTTGKSNTAIGSYALSENTTGGWNTASGYYALGSNSTGQSNSAFGDRSLVNNTTGSRNTALGDSALYSNSTASYNTAVGYGALYDANRTANVNAYNTAIGYNAGNTGTNDVTTGDKNVLVGASTAASAATASNQIVIGYGASGTGDNYAVIGNSDITRLYAASDGAGVLYANGTIQSSDRRIKRNIEDVSFGLNYIMSLRPVTYYKKHPRDYPQELKDKFYPDGKVREVSAEDYDKRQIGFIAQEVKEVNENMGVENNIVSIDEDGFHRMDYQKLVVPFIKAVQELSAKVDKLESQLEANSAEVSASQ